MCGQMMFIKKWPKLRKNNVLLTITQKCNVCKTVVEIDDLNDLEYAGKFSLGCCNKHKDSSEELCGYVLCREIESIYYEILG